MENILDSLKIQFKDLVFTPGDYFCWAPNTKEVFYDPINSTTASTWSLLHETGHAILNHSEYSTDYQLIRLEIEAWEKAKELAKLFRLSINNDHIEDCLDSYRDWLYKRSICPSCSTKCLQTANLKNYYRCFNCRTVWRVPASKLCRTYRVVKT